MSADVFPLLMKALGETVAMVVVAMIAATAVGVPLGVLLVVTAKGGVLECPALNRAVAGTSIGTTAAMVPLTLASIPFIGRQVETSLREVPYGIVEAALAMGATPMQIIRRVYLPEALPGIVAQLTTVVIALVGESAMAGAIGGGGLGDLAIRYGYQRFRPEIMLATVIVLIALVQLVQFAGNALAKRLNKKEL